MKSAPHTHSVTPVAVKPVTMRESAAKGGKEGTLPLLATDSRVRIATGNTQSAVRKIIASDKANKMTGNISRLQRLQNQQPDPPTRPGRSFFTFEALPAFKSEISLLPNLIESSANSPLKAGKAIQTDVFYERPESPPYIPPKVGTDEGTQITDLNELFNFDTECLPMVDTIVSKTISQALFEVQAEEELKSIQMSYEILSQRQGEEKQETGVRETNFIEDHSSRRAYIDNIKQTKAYERTLRTIVASKKLMADIIPGLVDDVVQGLLQTGVLKDSVESAVRDDIMPSILSKVATKSASLELSATLVDGMHTFYIFVSYSFYLLF